MQEVITGIAKRAFIGSIDKRIDYIGEDGLYHCGICGKAKQGWKRILGKDYLASWICDCQGTDKQEKEARERRIKERLEDCFGTRTVHNHPDDDSGSKIAGMCRGYAQKFTKSSPWLMMHGASGTGKSYRAAQICTEIIKRGYSAKFTSLGEIERELWDNDKSAVYKKLERYDLIVLDDFGAERRTDYTSEIRYNVIDTRYNSGKPLIFTTNITSFENKDIADSRVNSRIREKVLLMRFDGESRRKTRQLNEDEIERLLTEGGWEDL